MRGLVLIVLALGCAQRIGVERPRGGGGGGSPDGGVRTSTPADAGSTDGGHLDAAAVDASAPGCPGLAPKTAGLELAEVSDGSIFNAIAVGSGRVGVVFEDATARRVWFGVLNPDGSPRSAPRVIANNAISPAIAHADGDFAVMFHDLAISDLAFIRYDRNGNEVVRVRMAETVSSPAGYPKLAYRQERFFVAYYASVGADRYQVRAARIGFDGIRVETFSNLVPDSTGTALVDLTATAAGWAATWIDERMGTPRIYAARIGADGMKVRDMMLTNGAQTTLFPTIASDGAALEVCYDLNIGGTSREIECVHVDAQDRVSPPAKVVTGDRVASFPKTMWTGTRYVVVWAAENPGIGEIFGRVIHPDGGFDSPVIRLTEIPGTSAYPGIGWLGDGLGIGWYQYSAAAGWSYVYQSFPCMR